MERTTRITRQHRRQQSTPVSIQASQNQFSPVAIAQDPRDMQQTHMARPFAYGQDDLQVGITNPGQHQPQHHLQVAQQQQPSQQARPGQPSPQPVHLVNQSFPISLQEYRLRQHQELDAQIDFLMRMGTPSMQPAHSGNAVKMERSRSQPSVYHGVHLVNVPPHNMHMANQPNEGMVRGRPTSSHSMSHFDGRVSLQPDWTMTLQRPFTPPNQQNQDGLPMSPVATPFAYVAYQDVPAPVPASQQNVGSPKRRSQQPSRRPSAIVEEDEDESMDSNKTVKPARKSHTSVSIATGQTFEPLPSPPHTAPIKTIRKFDAAPMGQHAMPRMKFTSGNTDEILGRPVDSVPSSPEMNQFASAPGSFRSGMSNQSARTSVDWDHMDSPENDSLSPHAMSIGEMSIEDGAAEATGVTAAEVQSYISEQDIASAKWTCLYPECGKTFGRKENIRSHVQTHLGDRPYRCNHCDKRFVRQHDLKRHRLIHLGNKPHQCECGRGFARQDALTRHKQRGICEGAFENVVRKPAKRGRPRKHRPEGDERRTKAAKTRRRAADRACASSVSGESHSSYLDSPPMTSDDVFKDFASLAALQTDGFALPPSSFSYTPPMSPYSTGNAQSPRKSSPEAPATPAAENSPEAASTPAASGMQMQREGGFASNIGSQISSHPNSPPELSHSSPPSSTPMLDEFTLAYEENHKGGMQENGGDFDMFGFTSSSADNSGSMSMFGKSWNESSASDVYFDFKLSRGERGGADLMSKNLSDLDEAALFSENVDSSNTY